MLILSRKLNESLIIGKDIKVTVLGIVGNQCRLGIKASPEVKIFRQELFERIEKEQKKEQEKERDNYINNKECNCHCKNKTIDSNNVKDEQ